MTQRASLRVTVAMLGVAVGVGVDAQSSQLRLGRAGSPTQFDVEYVADNGAVTKRLPALDATIDGEPAHAQVADFDGDGYADVQLRAACGSGGCETRLYLFDPDTTALELAYAGFAQLTEQRHARLIEVVRLNAELLSVNVYDRTGRRYSSKPLLRITINLTARTCESSAVDGVLSAPPAPWNELCREFGDR